jgi:hypothetical protein
MLDPNSCLVINPNPVPYPWSWSRIPLLISISLPDLDPHSNPVSFLDLNLVLSHPSPDPDPYLRSRFQSQYLSSIAIPIHILDFTLNSYPWCRSQSCPRFLSRPLSSIVNSTFNHAILISILNLDLISRFWYLLSILILGPNPFPKSRSGFLFLTPIPINLDPRFRSPFSILILTPDSYPRSWSWFSLSIPILIPILNRSLILIPVLYHWLIPMKEKEFKS